VAARYQVIVRDQTGAQVAVLTTWYTLEYSRRLNDVGRYALELDGNLAAVEDFVVDGQIEILRRDQDAAPAIDWYTDFFGFHRTPQQRTDISGRSIFVSQGVDPKHLLARRAILYRDTTTGAAKTGAGETVMKAYVDENAGPGATAPPRLFAGVFPGLTVQADGAAGDAWAGNKPYRSLLDTLREIADATGVDFDVVSTGAATFEFQAQAQPLGEDRSTVGINPATGLNAAGNAPVIFSLDFGNMETPALTTHRVNEVTSVLVLGQGAEGNRVVVERTSAATADSPWNQIEAIKNANQVDSAAGLNAVGDALLQELQARETFTFSALQIPATLYGRDYFLGDRLTARYGGTERHFQVTGVTVRVIGGEAEDIDIEVGDVT
jgi:hypothetical protein